MGGLLTNCQGAPFSVAAVVLTRTSSVSGLIARPHHGKSAMHRQQLKLVCLHALRTFAFRKRRNDFAVSKRDVEVRQTLVGRDGAAVLGDACVRSVSGKKGGKRVERWTVAHGRKETDGPFPLGRDKEEVVDVAQQRLRH